MIAYTLTYTEVIFTPGLGVRNILHTRCKWRDCGVGNYRQVKRERRICNLKEKAHLFKRKL